MLPCGRMNIGNNSKDNKVEFTAPPTSTRPTSGTQKAMPHPLGSSRSHPAPQEVMSCPTCLPGWWTSRTGTRPCGGVRLSLEPGTSSSLLMWFSSCRATRRTMLGGERHIQAHLRFEESRWFAILPTWHLRITITDLPCTTCNYLVGDLVVRDVVPDGAFPQGALTAVCRWSAQHQLPPLLLLPVWNEHTAHTWHAPVWPASLVSEGELYTPTFMNPSFYQMESHWDLKTLLRVT